MKIAQINTVHYGSTGKIMLQIADLARSRDHDVLTFSKSWKNNSFKGKDHYYIGSYFTNLISRVLTPIFGKDGCFSYFSTSALIKQLNDFDPDVIHLHNIHGWYLNYEKLFKYIKEKDIAVIWTLHDCWTFTAQCPYFTISGCEKWKTGCHNCSQLREYPETYIDSSKKMWQKKKEMFTGIKNMTVVTPSKWLAGLAKESFLGEYTIKTINNGIDLSIFKPTESDFRQKYGCENKKILLGVSFAWGERKGLDVFTKLCERLDPEKYQIVLVGTDENIDKLLPDGIISIHSTHDQKELAEIYSAADLFVNPTREENYPTVNMESIACGTPVLTFRTGGSPEIVDENSGYVVDRDDVDAMEREINRICSDTPYTADMCLERAKSFDMHERFKEYVDLYEKTV